MNEIRCGACSRKLGEGEYTRLVIKCPRCGAMNQFQSAKRDTILNTPTTEAERHIKGLEG